MGVLHPASTHDLATTARGALMMWAFCRAGATTLRHEGLARASRAAAAAHAQSPPQEETIQRRFQYRDVFRVKLVQASQLPESIRGTGNAAASDRARLYADTHPDAELGGIKSVLTAL